MRRLLFIIVLCLLPLLIGCTQILNKNPGKPENPYPANESEVYISGDQLSLQWECSDPDGDELLYDVYFGTNNNPPLVKSNHTNKSYVVSGLESGKTYYWKIVAKDGKGGVTEGPVWRFMYIRKNNAPTQPTRPSPKDNEMIATLTGGVVLSWECSDPDGDTLTYDIYFGSNINPPLVKSGHTSSYRNVFEIPNLEHGKRYYWKIVAKDGNGGVTEGPVWSFVLYTISSSDLIWTKKISSQVFSSPAIGENGTIYFGTNGYYVYALNSNSTYKWSFSTGGFVMSSPALGEDGTVYVGSYDKYIYALNPNGTLKWKYQTNGEVVSSPALGEDGTIYVGSADKYIYALNPNGTLKWKYQTNGEVRSSPAIGKDGTVYVGSYDGYIYAFDPNGALKWNYQTDMEIFSSPLLISYGQDEFVIVCGVDSYIYNFQNDGTLIVRILTHGSIFSSPTIGSGFILYVTENGYIYAMPLGASTLSSGSWPKFRGNIRNTGRTNKN